MQNLDFAQQCWAVTLLRSVVKSRFDTPTRYFRKITGTIKEPKIAKFLTSLPNIDEIDARRALLHSAGLDKQLQDQIDIAGPPAHFFQLLVRTLSDYGTLKDGRNALQAVLESAKNHVGQDRKDYCDTLIQEIDVVLQ